MRFNPQETTGSRVRIRYSVELHYELSGPAEFLLNVHAARTPRQTVVEECFDITPFRPASLDVDPASGNRRKNCGCLGFFDQLLGSSRSSGNHSGSDDVSRAQQAQRRKAR